MRIELIAQVPLEKARRALLTRLSSRSVETTQSVNEIKSTHIPIPMFSFDSRAYSRGNWFGLNPFLNLSRIEIHLDEADQGAVSVVVDIAPNRVWFWFCWYAACAVAVLPFAPVGSLVFGGVLVVACPLAFYLTRILVQQELVDALRA